MRIFLMLLGLLYITSTVVAAPKSEKSRYRSPDLYENRESFQSDYYGRFLDLSKEKREIVRDLVLSCVEYMGQYAGGKYYYQSMLNFTTAAEREAHSKNFKMSENIFKHGSSASQSCLNGFLPSNLDDATIQMKPVAEMFTWRERHSARALISDCSKITADYVRAQYTNKVLIGVADAETQKIHVETIKENEETMEAYELEYDECKKGVIGVSQ